MHWQRHDLSARSAIGAKMLAERCVIRVAWRRDAPGPCRACRGCWVDCTAQSGTVLVDTTAESGAGAGSTPSITIDSSKRYLACSNHPGGFLFQCAFAGSWWIPPISRQRTRSRSRSRSRSRHLPRAILARPISSRPSALRDPLCRQHTRRFLDHPIRKRPLFISPDAATRSRGYGTRSLARLR